MLVSYNWLQSYIEDTLPDPESLVDSLSLHAFEIEGLDPIRIDDSQGESTSNGTGQIIDWVIDVDVLPNRAHDALSHFGIAREITVILGLTLKERTRKQIEAKDSDLEIEIKNKDKCRRYIGREIDNIQVGPSPDWLKKSLETIGQKSINNVVDATNYVMFSFGQPLHAFDADKLESKKIIIRDAKEGEKITLLTGEEISLSSLHLVIADEAGALAIAGVKGGTKAEVEKSTTNIIIESANFEPVSTRKTAHALHIHTDSVKRFENEISPEFSQIGMDEVVELISEIAGSHSTKINTQVDVYPHPVESWRVQLRSDDISAVLGVTISLREVEDILKRFGFEYSEATGIFDIAIPFYRLDLKIKEDVIEEIARIYGYSNIKGIIPNDTVEREVNKKFYYASKIRKFLTEHAYSEVYTYSFVHSGDVEMINPLASDKKFLRNSLVEGLQKSVELNSHNKDLLMLDAIKIFEIGTVFKKNREHMSLALASTEKQKELENSIEMLGEHLGIKLNGKLFENVLEIDLDDAMEVLPDVDEYGDVLKVSEVTTLFSPISQYPVISRDIAVWIPNNQSKEDLVSLIKDRAGTLLVTEPRLFDQFTPEKDSGNKYEGNTSYAYRLVFQSQEKTLSDNEVNVFMDAINKGISSKSDWEVR
ncbi:hypothetical protein COB64_03570 [Candidatus Wolfebacteria bacterium]|nr:MAG: hypothetical protein COB64_03570 [Candidatus Wolfebacteria bacterium]